MSALYEKFEESFEIGFILLECTFDRLTLKEIGKFSLYFFSCFYYTLILFFNLFSEFLSLLL